MMRGEQPQRDEGMEMILQVQECRMVSSEGKGDRLYGSGMGGYKEWDAGEGDKHVCSVDHIGACHLGPGLSLSRYFKSRE